jgi:tetratricopeptide (TPR) repeat protein
MQYKTSLVQMAVRLLKKGDAAAAKEKLEKALLYPENLGEGRLEGTKDNHIWYWLGRALEALGQKDEAKKAYQNAELGEDEPAGAMYYYDQPADMILFKGLAKEKLGKKKEACMCFNKLMDYGERHVKDVMEYDYFAVSMPDFLIFETDLTKKNTAHCWYLMGLAAIGSNDREKAAACFDKALEYEYDHQNAILYKRMLEEDLF